MNDNQIDAFRARYRRDEIGPRYSGMLHLAITTSVCLAGMVVAASRLESVLWWEWLAVPVTFLFANAAEHAGHRGPMHHRRNELDGVFRRHTRQHHRFFTRERMNVDVSRDVKAVLVPPVLAVFFIAFFVLPAAIPLALLATPNVAGLFAVTGIGYFLNYEWLHYAYHADDRSRLARLPCLAHLRRHHALHHDPALMSRYNFNITFPIADWFFGTLYKYEDRGIGGADSAVDQQLHPSAEQRLPLV